MRARRVPAIALWLLLVLITSQSTIAVAQTNTESRTGARVALVLGGGALFLLGWAPSLAFKENGSAIPFVGPIIVMRARANEPSSDEGGFPPVLTYGVLVSLLVCQALGASMIVGGFAIGDGTPSSPPPSGLSLAPMLTPERIGVYGRF
jgi:hypothetical protein